MLTLDNQCVYILVEEANFPFCLPPKQGEDLILIVYSDESDAKTAFCNFMEGESAPFMIPHKVLELSYSSVIDLIPEMEVYAEEEYDAKFSIQLNVRLGDIRVICPSLVEKHHLN